MPEKAHTQHLKDASNAYQKALAVGEHPLATIKKDFMKTWHGKITDEEIQTIFNLNALDFNIESVDEFSEKELKETVWIVPDLIPEGLTLLAGDAKIGKSFFCWNIALAVAQAGTLFSKIDIPDKRNVLFFCLEEPEKQIQDRIHSLCPRRQKTQKSLRLFC